MWQGLVGIVVVVLLLGMVPVVSNWYADGIRLLLPMLFLVHSMMALAVLVDGAIWLLMRLIVRRGRT